MKTRIALPFLLTLLIPVFCLADGEKSVTKNMVRIPAGDFILGLDSTEGMPSFMSNTTSSQNARPQQTVRLSEFFLDPYEVTYGEFIQFKPSATYPEGRVDHPVRGVTWYEAEAFCFWMGKRLPTEFEWEKAARGNGGNVFVWGNQFAMDKGNFGKTVKRVGSFPTDKTVLGVFDLNGNVSEWTGSRYAPYPGSTFKDPNYGKDLKVIRGGAYNKREHGFLKAFATLTFRNPAPPSMRSWDTGFRCAYSIEPAEKN